MRAPPLRPESSSGTPAGTTIELSVNPGAVRGVSGHDGSPGYLIRRAVARTLLGTVLTGLAGCASLEFSRDTETAGTFSSSAMSFTIISVDMPRSAIDAARENVTDARQPNLVMTKATIWPYLGPADWLLDIIGFRYAKISGTWGFHEE